LAVTAVRVVQVFTLVVAAVLVAMGVTGGADVHFLLTEVPVAAAAAGALAAV